ncbi:putative mediator of RNA polymerase II transcription subunit 26 isoform X1 [Cuculus canorus]|uniref:putative mediator of RNA polymerase II transcription subunit 26 isoform X1 n=1 Tax=Cuculus canorus TaxID=55661 RepID=UPI0023AAC048|nr:putative mediator of RNA polymerase II transcription subunit 26 isoform X1 [Cuculus canorus]
MYKKGQREDPGNSKPVTLTSVLGKVVEQVISSAITQHMQENRVVRPSQHGFMKGRAAAMASNGLSERLDSTFLNPEFNTIDLKALYNLLQAILQRLRDQSPEALLEEIREMKATQARMVEEVRKIQEEQHGSTLQMKQVLNELQEQQKTNKATLEQLVAQTADQQAQLNDLRAALETMKQEQAKAHTVHSSSQRDTQAQLKKLLEDFRKIQEQVDSVAHHPADKEQEETLTQLQAAVKQLRGDHQKLSSFTANFRDSCQENQNNINALFQALKSLEKDKEEKEQRLKQVREEVNSKLDRQELEPLLQQLKSWKKIVEQLQKESSPRDAAEAAVTKQSLNRRSCLSCDRPMGPRGPGPEQAARVRFPTVPRSCGGQHTITTPLQLYMIRQPKPPITPRPRKDDEETILLGRDGRVYRGCRKRRQTVVDVKEDGSAASRTGSDGHLPKLLFVPAQENRPSSLADKPDKLRLRLPKI